MSEIPDHFDEGTANYVAEIFKDIVVGFKDQFDQRISLLESTLENLEKQIATLVVGYGEQAVFMEALVAQLAFATEDHQKAFTDNLAAARKKMLEVMQDASTVVANDNPNIGSAIADVAGEKLSDTDQ